MGDIIHNISRVDQAVCWPNFTAPYSTKPSAELSSRFRLTLSCCSTTSTVDGVQRYARYARYIIYALVHVMLSYLLWPLARYAYLTAYRISARACAYIFTAVDIQRDIETLRDFGGELQVLHCQSLGAAVIPTQDLFQYKGKIIVNTSHGSVVCEAVNSPVVPH